MLVPNLPALHCNSCFQPERNGLHQPLAPYQLLVNIDSPPHPSDDELQLGFALSFLGLLSLQMDLKFSTGQITIQCASSKCGFLEAKAETEICVYTL